MVFGSSSTKTADIYPHYSLLPQSQSHKCLGRKSPSSPPKRLNSRLEICVLNDLSLLRNFVGKTHVGSEGAVWHPLSRVARVGLLEHAINLFKSEALGLGNQEVRVSKAEEAEGPPNEEDLRAKVCLVFVDHVWGND